MAILRPFRGITYDASRVDLSRVVAPPYDVISDRDRVRYYEQDEHNVVRLIAGEVRPTDSAEDNKYLRAARFYNDWLEQGILRREAQPTIYVYRHEFDDPTTGEARWRHGILAVVELEPFGNGILPHERTHARAKADRLSLTRAVSANLSPIFALYEDPQGAMGPILDDASLGAPRLSIEDGSGERHLVWSITDLDCIRRGASVLQPCRLFIADGHHRYETALNFRNKMLAEHPEAPPDAAFNFVLMLLVDVADPGLIILPTHRMIHDVQGFDGPTLVKRLSSEHQVTPHRTKESLVAAMHEPVEGHRIGLAVGQSFYTIDMSRGAAADPVSELDVSVLHQRIIHGLLGLPEEDERFISYSRDLDAVLETVSAGTAQAAFLLRPPAVSDVVAVARAGQVMPQKSTYFYPKPASGIVFNPLDPDIRIPAV